MAYKDLRSFIDDLDARGQLKRVTAEVDGSVSSMFENTALHEHIFRTSLQLNAIRL